MTTSASRDGAFDSVILDLYEISRALASQDETSLWDALYSPLASLFSEYSFFLALHSPQEDSLALPIVCEEGISQPYAPIPVCGYSRAVIRSGKELYIADSLAETERLLALGIVPDEREPASWARSRYALPLRGADKTLLGLLCVCSGEPDAFDNSTLGLIATVASQIALGLSVLEQRQSERARRGLLSALMDASQAVAAAREPDEALERIIDLLSRLFGADAVALLLRESDDDDFARLNLYYTSDPDDVPAERLVSLNARNPIRMACLAQQPVIIADAQREPAWDGYAGLPGASHLRAWLGLPMIVRDQVVGIIVLGSRAPAHYQDSDTRIAFALARQAAIAVDSARSRYSYQTSLDVQVRRARRLDLIHRVGALISASLDPDQVLQTTAQLLTELFEVDHCGILMLRQGGEAAQLVSEYPDWGLSALEVPLQHNSIMRRLREERLPLAIAEADIDGLDQPTRLLLQRVQSRSTLLAPLVAGDEFIGSIGLDSIGRSRAFTDEERETVMTIAGQVAMAMRNAGLYTEAITANRLKNEFLANMSHELRTPLNAIIGYSDMLSSGFYGELNPQQEDRVQRIVSSGRHLLMLINDVLDFSRLESGHITPQPRSLQLDALASEAIEAFRAPAQASGLTLELQTVPPLPAAFADPMLVRQALNYLMDNAIKFTPAGSVTLCVCAHRFSGGISDHADRLPPRFQLPDGLWLALGVRDTGIGIAPENQALVFESFRQVDSAGDRAFGGTGLGLAITRELVTLQGGAIALESAPGVGSTFTLLLPAAPQVSSSAINPRQPLILAVDNDPAALQLLQDYLEGADFQIIGTTEPAQALDLALRYPPALVITDVLMPHINGYALAETLRTRPATARVPLLFLSAEQRQPDAPFFTRSEFLLKPVGRDLLLSTIRSALGLDGAARATSAAPDR